MGDTRIGTQRCGFLGHKTPLVRRKATINYTTLCNGRLPASACPSLSSHLPVRVSRSPLTCQCVSLAGCLFKLLRWRLEISEGDIATTAALEAGVKRGYTR